MLVANSDASEAEALVARIYAGEARAEEELVACYQRPVLAIATARTRDREAALDLTQEIMMAVLKAVRAGQVREAQKLAAFVHGTTRNLINNYVRARERRAESELDPAELLSQHPIEELELAEQRRLVRKELESYSVRDQQILLFSLVDGHSLMEVASRLKMSHDAVRARKSRLIRKITRKFAGLSQK